MNHIKHLLIINAPVETIYQNISTQEGLQNWWTKETIAKAEVGFKNDFKFGGDYHKVMRINELSPNKSVSWICEGGDKEWLGTELTFSIETINGKNTLRFAHKNWREATDFFESCNYHWGYYMHSLKLLCETGQGTPHSISAKIAN